MWYLHGPDRTTSYEVTLKAVNDLYKEGHFKALGISNYMSSVYHLLIHPRSDPHLHSWEVAQMVEICRSNGYIQPTVYQGVYNAIQRFAAVFLTFYLAHKSGP
jgi:aflatoxin B1 aldehyde reductase